MNLNMSNETERIHLVSKDPTVNNVKEKGYRKAKLFFLWHS